MRLRTPPIQTDQTPIAGDSIDSRLAPRDVSNRLSILDTLGHRLPARIEAAFKEIDIHDMRQIALLVDDCLGIQASKGSVMLMHAVNGDAIRVDGATLS